MASARCLVSLPDLDISNPRKTSMVRAPSSSTNKNTTTSSFLPLAFTSSIPIKDCKISFFSKRSRKFAIKARENLPNSEATLAADAFSKFKHMLLPVTDRNPYLSEGTRQAAATTADLAKKYGADITVVVIDENPMESLPEHSTHLSSIRWHLSEGGFQEFRLIERLGSGCKPTAIIDHHQSKEYMKGICCPHVDYYNMIIFVVIILSSAWRIESKLYTVGDDSEWSSGIDYLSWSQKYNFSIGDVLVFNYVKLQHNTVEVTEDTFKSCDDSRKGSVLAIYASGHDEVKLTEARKYWFICTIPGHCHGGMRFGIDVNLLPMTGAGGNNETTLIPTPTGGDSRSKSSSPLHIFIIDNGVFVGVLHFVFVILLHLL